MLSSFRFTVIIAALAIIPRASAITTPFDDLTEAIKTGNIKLVDLENNVITSEYFENEWLYLYINSDISKIIINEYLK